MKKDNIIQDKSFQFALDKIELYKELILNKELILSKQLLNIGTSIGANVEEAIEGISKKDFTAKMSIASKEARETRFWLRLYQASKLVDLDYSTQLSRIEEIINILTAIVKPRRKRMISNLTFIIQN